MAPNIHLDQPSIKDLEVTTKFFGESKRRCWTPEHKDLEVRIKSDADSGEVTVTDNKREVFDDATKMLTQWRQSKKFFLNNTSTLTNAIWGELYMSGHHHIPWAQAPGKTGKDIDMPSIRDRALIEITPERVGDTEVCM